MVHGQQSDLYGPPPFDPGMNQALYGVPARYEIMERKELGQELEEAMEEKGDVEK